MAGHGAGHGAGPGTGPRSGLLSLYIEREEDQQLFNVQSCRGVLGDQNGWSWSRPWSRPLAWPTSGLLSLYIEREEN